MTGFQNVYDDDERATAYADLEFPGTYYLAFRDIPSLIDKHVSGTDALDFGCGAGRSTRFLRDLGFNAIGADISAAMLREASLRDPQGIYLLVQNDDIGALGDRAFDLILAAFTFDNIPVRERRIDLFRQLSQHLRPNGRIINLVSSEQIYLNEWLSFSTKDFPENRTAESGDLVRITMLDVPDRRPIEDIVWTERDYAETFDAAGLQVIEVHQPLGTDEDPYEWVSERTTAPWTIHVLASAVCKR